MTGHTENEATRTADVFNALADRLENLLNEFGPRGPRGGSTIDANTETAEHPQLRIVDDEKRAA